MLRYTYTAFIDYRTLVMFVRSVLKNPITPPYKVTKLQLAAKTCTRVHCEHLNATTAMSQFLQHVIVFIAYLQLKFLCTVMTSCDVKKNIICMWDSDSKNQTIPLLMYNNLNSLLISFGIKGLWVEIFYLSLTVLIILRWRNKYSWYDDVMRLLCAVSVACSYQLGTHDYWRK